LGIWCGLDTRVDLTVTIPLCKTGKRTGGWWFKKLQQKKRRWDNQVGVKGQVKGVEKPGGFFWGVKGVWQRRKEKNRNGANTLKEKIRKNKKHHGE